MPDLDQQQNPAHEAVPGGQACTVLRAPADVSDTMLVEIDATGHDEEIGHRWSSHGAALPAVGDRGVVVFDAAFDAWLVEWDGPGAAASGGGSSAPYVHTQASPSAVWTINHGLGHHPVIVVENEDAEVVEVAVQHTNSNTSVASPASATSGVAYAYP